MLWMIVACLVVGHLEAHGLCFPICGTEGSWKKGSGEPFRHKRDVLPPIRGDALDCASADLCANLATRCHVNCIKSPQPDSGTMATN